MAPLDLNHIAVSEGRGDAAQALHALHTLGLDEREVEEVDEGELLEMAAHLGCEVDAIDQLPTSVRWIVEKALEAPLPDNWSEATDDKGSVYYFNRQTHKTSWDHPMDDYFRIMVQKALMNPLADELDSPARAIARGGDAHSSAAAAAASTAATSNSSPTAVAVDSPNVSTGLSTPPTAAAPAAVSTPPTIVVAPPPAAAGIDALKRAAAGDYSPATVRYALHLGLTPEIDTELLWVAEQALNAPLPPNWSEDVTDDGTVFFRNHLTGAVNWSHPLDDHFRGLIVKLKLQQQRASERARRGDAPEEDEDEDEDEDDYSSHTDDDDSTSTDGSTMMSGSGWTASAGGDSVPGATFKDVQIALGLRSALDGAAAAVTGRHSAGADGGGGIGGSPSTSTADTRTVAPAPTTASVRQRQQRRHARSREKSEKGEKGRTRIAELGRALSGRLRRLSAHGNNAASSSQQPKSRPTSAAARAKLEWERNVLNLDSTIGSEEEHSLSNSSLKLQGLT